MTAHDFDNWIGRQTTAPADLISDRLIASIAATFGAHISPVGGIAPGLHWCLAPPMVDTFGLSADGHPARGDFLPPIPLPRRMWASGDIAFLDRLHPGDSITRVSTIKDIIFKSGSSGPLWFVVIEHRYTREGASIIVERQTLAYRDAAEARARLPERIEMPNDLDHMSDIAISTAFLFRFSALTFNAHRIHYDRPYAQEVEFYTDIVIHGPLQAMLLLNFATKIAGDVPRRCTYRGVAPATGAQTLRLGAKRMGDGCDMAIYTEVGHVSMTAYAEW